MIKSIILVVLGCLMPILAIGQTYSDELLKKAQAGNAAAMNIVGVCYHNGAGVPRDDSQAFYWYKQAAERGEMYAMFNLGMLYENGEGVSKDLDNALFWYFKAAEMGNDEAMNLVGVRYHNGIGVPRDDSRAFYWYNKAADKGNMYALYNLGMLYEKGEGVSKDLKKAFSCHKKAAEKGHVVAMICVGVHYRFGMGVSRDDSQAFYWYNRAAEKGNVDAMSGVGTCYYGGIGVAQDYSQAFYWYNKAAEKGSDEAMANLGILYGNGQGVPKDPAQAFYWYRQAADRGNNQAMNDIGICYHNGTGVAQDFSQAFYWYKQAAERGNVDAICNLGILYRYGLGVSKDLAKADLLVEASGAAKSGNIQHALTLVAGVVGEKPLLEQKKTEQPVQEFAGEDDVNVDVNIPHTGMRNSNTFAVVIANENYDTESKVDFAHNDGQMVQAYLKEVLGLPECNIHFKKDATLNNIRREVNWLDKVARGYEGKASIIFYYAGHGVPDVQSKKSYLLPSDGVATDIYSTFSLNDLYEKLSNCPSRSTVVFLDACFSGSQRSGENLASVRAVGIRAKAGTPKGNMVVFSAAQGNETAYPLKEQKHGMFTYYLLKKLKDSKGKVTLGELGDYLTGAVKRKSIVIYTEDQTPSVQASERMRDNWRNLYLGR